MLEPEQCVEMPTGPGLHAGKVVEERRMLGLLCERLLVDRDRLVPTLLLGCGAPGLPPSASTAVSASSATAARLNAGSRTKTNWPAARSCSFPSIVKRAWPRSTK
jgi:hypothetical protein